MNQVSEAVGLDLVQLHGSEGTTIARQLRRPAIRVLPVIPHQTTASEVEMAMSSIGSDVAAVLLDTKLSAHVSGGTGTTFDWRIAAQVSQHYPVMVAGGLTPANVRLAVVAIRPLVVDVASGVEREDGSCEKDVDKMRAFVRAAAHTEQHAA